MSPTFKSLRHRNYRLYWSSMLVSNIGTWMQRVAQDWLVLVVLGAGPAALGITTGLQFLPFLLVSPIGGLLADRLPKRHLLRATNAFMGLVGLTLGVLTLTGTAQVWHVYLLAFLLGVGAALDNPARQAFVSELVTKDDLPNAVGLNSASFNAARLIGPAVAGLLIAVVGTGWVFVINAATFIAPIVALTVLRLVAVERDDRDVDAGTLARLRGGISYVRSRPDIVMIMLIMFFVGTFGMNFQLNSALMATGVFGKGPTEYGVLGSIMAVGTLSGALVAARRGRTRRRYIVLGAIAFGTVLVIAGFMPTYEMFAVTLVPLGIASMTVLTAANAYIQVTVPQHVRGRVMSLYVMVLMGGTPLGAPVIGAIAEALGPRWSLWVGGGITMGATVIATLVMAGRNGFVVRPRMRPLPRIDIRPVAESHHVASVN
jgi:MFS family permease